jgi:hypothetical protein
MTRSMLLHAKLPKMFWGEAIRTAIYVLNRVTSKSIKLTAYELWIGRKLDLTHLHK